MPHANCLRAIAARGPARYRQAAARGNMLTEKLCNDHLTEVKSSFFRCTWARATYRSAHAGAAETACTTDQQIAAVSHSESLTITRRVHPPALPSTRGQLARRQAGWPDAPAAHLGVKVERGVVVLVHKDGVGLVG